MKRLTKWQQKSTSESAAMENIVYSMFNSQPLYDKLKVRCHPDRFIDTQKEDIANSLFQELQQNRYNFQKLKELQVKIESLLYNDKR